MLESEVLMNESRFGVSPVIYPDLKENSILHYKYFLFLIYNRIIQNFFLYLFTPVYNLLEFISLFIIFFIYMFNNIIWAVSSEFGYRLCEQRMFRRACASAQSRQNLRCSLIQAVSQEEPSDRKPDPWPL